MVLGSAAAGAVGGAPRSEVKMHTEEEILIAQQVDQSWVVTLPSMARPWAVERTRDQAIARARQYAPCGIARVHRPDGKTERVSLAAGA